MSPEFWIDKKGHVYKVINGVTESSPTFWIKDNWVYPWNNVVQKNEQKPK